MANKWQIDGWGAAQGQIREAVEFVCNGKSVSARSDIAEDLVTLVREIALGEKPKLQSSPYDQDEHSRESWARATADHIVSGALRASERSTGPLPTPDQVSLLREIARIALWHMPNSGDETRRMVRNMDVENLKQPNPLDDDPPGG